MSTDRAVIEAAAVVLDADPDELTTATPLSGIEGWDSVNALRLLAYLERHLDTRLDFERFHSVTTIADLVTLVDQTRS